MELVKTLGPKGQVLIPKLVREHLGISPGGTVVLVVRDGAVELRPPAGDVVSSLGSSVRTKLRSKPADWDAECAPPA